MLKVLIADDEALICRLITMLADWDALGMEVAATASNGLEALDLIQLHRPDILVTDIRMPGVSGLALIEYAKSILPDLEIMIISGYAHFDYAQTAIRFGVSDYLLKPIQQNELMTTLRKLGERCAKRSQLSSRVAELQQSNDESRHHLREALIQDMVDGRLQSPSAASLLERYRFAVQPGLFAVLLMKFDYEAAQFAPQSIAVILENTEKLLFKEFEGLCYEMAVSFRAFRAYGVLNFAPENREGVRRALRNCLNRFAAQRTLYGDIAVSMSLGACVSRPEDLPVSCAGADDAILERLVEGTEHLFERVPAPSGLLDGSLLEQYRRMLRQAAETGEDSGAAVDFLADATSAITNARGREIVQLVFSAAQIFLSQCGAPDIEDEIRTFQQSCDSCRSAAALLGQLRQLQSTWTRRIDEQRKSDLTRPIREAKRFVQQHYAEPITLEEVCAVVGFSVSYFSALFKKESGEGFSKYLTRVRIDHAKELLQETGEPIADICCTVGYSDLKHFTQTFKKLTSLSPSQYRKLYG